MADPVTLALAGGTLLSTGGAYAEGEAAEQAAAFKAKTQMATGSRRAYEAGRKGRILQSDIQAAQAASGGAVDAGSIERMAKVGAETEYNVLSALYEGKQKATTARYEGKIKKKAAKKRALSTLLSGGASAYKSYTSPLEG